MGTVEHAVAIPHPKGVTLHGDLAVPEQALGMVVFAHGSGSSRHSPRNRMVAAHLGARGFATLLLDLLTDAEEQADRVTAQLRFDIELLAERLLLAADWCRSEPGSAKLPLAYFGASTGAAAALIAAASAPEGVFAVVSRGGRPDLAGPWLSRVRAPTLLIAGGDDPVVVDLNRRAQAQLVAPSMLEIVPGATHLFEEPGALQRVAELAADWLASHVPNDVAGKRAG